jgi:phage shock protein PspC (stress-responsive transcriptional regulator)
MNKTLNINLGGYPFIIDDEAYELLDRYLSSIRRHFQYSSSYAEITGDIENRLAEIFSEKLGSRTIINLNDVNTAIEIMGKPEEFGAEPIDNQEYSSTNRTQHQNSEYRTGKRLFRDPEDKVVGGVCSGIAAYFGIEDPLWVRLFFVLLVFVFGVSAVFYFILWMAIPEATSSADRLAMRGEPINISNIAKVVEEEFNNLSEAYKSGGKTAENQKKNEQGQTAYSSSYNRNRASQGIADVMSFVGDLGHRLFDFIRLLFKPVFGFIGIIALIVLACFWIGLVIAFAYGHPFAKALFGDSTFMAYLAGFNVFFMIAAVIAILVLLFLNLFFKIRVKPKWYGVLGAFWLFNGMSFAFMGTHLGAEFSEDSSIKSEIFNAILPSDTLNIDVIKNRNTNFGVHFGNIKINDKDISYEGVDFRVRKSETTEFRAEKILQSNGRTTEEAEQLISQINYTPTFDGKTFTLNKYLDLTGQKFRGQNVEIILYVPVGKYIRYGKNCHNFIAFDYDDNYDCEDDNNIQVWQMGDNGEMSCPMAKRQNAAEKTFSNKDFKSLKIRGEIEVEIKKGATYSVRLEGKEKLFKEVEIIQNETTLNIRSSLNEYWDERRKPMRLVITAPSLELIDVENAKNVTISGFTDAEMRMNFYGEMDVDIIADINNITLDIEQAEVHLQGKGNSLNVNIDENGKLKARQFTVKTAKVKLESGTADIFATEKVEQRGNSENLDVSGGAEIDKLDKKSE